MSVARKMTVIPAVPKVTVHNDAEIKKKRVAAYARVSTDTEEQLSSYEAQVDHYTNHIKNNENWHFKGVYTDEGISATSTKNREGFKRMINDALSGKIDLIITKSVSRFARNTVDTLTTVRKLKEKGVEVYFEKENIYTLDSKGELLITIMSSLAQEESRSISENVTWGQRKRFADGKINLPYKHFLGYEKGENGLPKIIESEAKIIRLIYRMFLEGKTPSFIAKHLTEQKIPTPANRQIWQSSTVESILTNEKYKGDAVLQKTFTVDFLTKKKKINEGEVQQYYIEESHPAIIPPETFDLVQIEFQKRKGQRKSTAGVFASKVICGECGGFYGSKVWHSTSKYRRIIWQCNQKFKNNEKCSTPHFTEEQLKQAFVDVFNSTIDNRDEIISTVNELVCVLADTSRIDAQIEKQQKAVNISADNIRLCVEENGRYALNQDEYEKHYGEVADKYQEEKTKLDSLQTERTIQISKQKETQKFLNTLKANNSLITTFDESLFYSLIDTITVVSDKELAIAFMDGSGIKHSI
jgi:DNA invertase Pin-like site-specific DNA recombinase